jgi:hypothetical protein
LRLDDGEQPEAPEPGDGTTRLAREDIVRTGAKGFIITNRPRLEQLTKS